MKKILLLAVLMLGVSYAVHAADAVISGAQVTYSYKEPSTNADGSPLADLKTTTIYYTVNGGATVKAKDEAASAKTGGGAKSSTFTVPIVDSNESTLRFWSTATDESGNESVASAVTVKRIDKLAPSSPE